MRPFTLESGLSASYQLAYPIQVRRKPGELVLAQPSRTFLTRPTFPSTDLHAATSEAPLPETRGQDHSLSAGAIAGIVIGGVAAAVIIGLLIWILVVLRKRTKSRLAHDVAARDAGSDSRVDPFAKIELPSPSAEPPMRTKVELLSNDLLSRKAACTSPHLRSYQF